jgi:Cu-processing system permease protein
MLDLVLMGLRTGSRASGVRLLLGMGVLLVGLALLAASFSGRQPMTVGLDAGLSGLRFLLLVMVLVWVQLLLAQDIERKTLYFMLAYPFSRGQFLVARFITLALLSGLATLLLGGLLWVAISLFGDEAARTTQVALDVRYLLVLCGLWLDLLVVLAFAVLLCTLSTTPFLPLLLGLAFAFAARGLGPTFDYLRKEAYPDLSAAPWFAPVLEHAYAWLPDLSRLDWRPLALYALPVEPAAMGLAALMGLAYIVLLLAIAMQVFQRRDFT